MFPFSKTFQTANSFLLIPELFGLPDFSNISLVNYDYYNYVEF